MHEIGRISLNCILNRNQSDPHPSTEPYKTIYNVDVYKNTLSFYVFFMYSIDDFRGACAVKGNGAVAGHVKGVDHDDVFDALLFREETLTRHYFILKFDFSWGIRTNMGKT